MNARSMLAAGTVCCSAALFSAAPVAAQPDEGLYARVNDSLVLHHVLPRYAALTEATGQLETVASRGCGGDAEEALRGAFQDAMDAWFGVAHVGFGPVELFMRNYRMYFWPEARGRIDDALRDLASSGSDALDADRFRDASVAAQGLPALEHLLYGGVSGHLTDESRCALVRAIAGNLAAMASDIEQEWRDGQDAFRITLTTPGPGNPFFATHRDATLELFKSFHAGLQVIADVRLKPVVGESIEQARPALADSAASGRGLRNIVVGLEALQAMYVGEDGAGLRELVLDNVGDPGLDALMARAFTMTIDTARGVDATLGEAVTDPALREHVERLNTQVLALKQIVRTRLADATGLGVGFNALDGD